MKTVKKISLLKGTSGTYAGGDAKGKTSLMFQIRLKKAITIHQANEDNWFPQGRTTRESFGRDFS